MILCGPSGSGKSTFAHRFFEPTQVVSSDRCRELASDTEDFHPASTPPAFRILHALIEERLALGRLTAIDSTALLHWMRAPHMQAARRLRVPVHLIVFMTPLEECVRRDRLRKRSVGRWIIERQFRELETGLLEIPHEPFEGVHLVTPEVENLMQVTVAAAGELSSAEQLPPDTAGPPRKAPALVLDEARGLLEGLPAAREALASARLRLASGGDAGWHVALPMVMEALRPARPVKSPAAAWGAARRRLADCGTVRAILRAAPPGCDGLAVVAQNADVAAESLLDDSARTASLLLPAWRGADAPAFTERLAHAREDVLNTGFLRRHARAVAAFDVRLAGDRAAPRLVVTGMASPGPVLDAASPEFFWDFLEADALTGALESTPRRVVAGDSLKDEAHEAWVFEQAALGHEVWIAASTTRGRQEEAEIGSVRPPLRVWPPAGPGDEAAEETMALFRLRRLAQRALDAGDFASARMVVEAGWARRPAWRADVADLFPALAPAGE